MAQFKSPPFRPWDLPDRYDPDYKLFLDREPVSFALPPPMSTHQETLRPKYGDLWVSIPAAEPPPIYIEIRRVNNKKWAVCRVKSPGGLILRKFIVKKTRAEAEQVFRKFTQVG